MNDAYQLRLSDRLTAVQRVLQADGWHIVEDNGRLQVWISPTGADLLLPITASRYSESDIARAERELGLDGYISADALTGLSDERLGHLESLVRAELERRKADSDCEYRPRSRLRACMAQIEWAGVELLGATSGSTISKYWSTFVNRTTKWAVAHGTCGSNGDPTRYQGRLSTEGTPDGALTKAADRTNSKLGDSDYTHVRAAARFMADENATHEQLHRAYRDASPNTMSAKVGLAPASDLRREANLLGSGSGPAVPTTAPASGPRAPRQRRSATIAGITAGQSVYLRPNGKPHYPQQIMGHEDVGFVQACAPIGRHAAFESPPGTGKTGLFESAFGLNLRRITCNPGTTVDDFAGQYIPKPGGGNEWQDRSLTKAMLEGKPYFVDEFGRCDIDVQSVLLDPMADGRLIIPMRPDSAGGQEIEAAPGFCVYAAFNPDDARLNHAVMDRFLGPIVYTTNFDLARTTLGVNADVVTAAEAMDGERLNPFSSVRWAPQMRALLEVRDVAAVFGLEFAVSALIAKAPEDMRDDLKTALAAANPRFRSLDRLVSSTMPS